MNIITVGGVAQTSSDALIHDTSARYISDYPITKPNISAINRLKIPNCNPTGSVGTSVAAPQVTACIALMAEYMSDERNYQITLFPESIMAILTATASKTDDYSCDYGYFDDKVGAGLLNLERMVSGETIVFDYTFEDAFEGMTHTPHAFTLQAGQTLQLSLVMFSYISEDRDIDSTIFTDYDITIYPLIGATPLESSGFGWDSNVELIRYTASTTEVIRISIEACEDCVHTNGVDYVAWSYCIVE